MPAPIDPSFAVGGPDWSVGSVGQADAAAPAAATGSGDGFAGALGQAIQGLQSDQQAASDAVRGMVSGTSTDPTEAVMALERARLSMQLAAQIRTKGVEALQDIFHTQV
jgi:flagellar hook-basal body complex protein FliE